MLDFNFVNFNSVIDVFKSAAGFTPGAANYLLDILGWSPAIEDTIENTPTILDTVLIQPAQAISEMTGVSPFYTTGVLGAIEVGAALYGAKKGSSKVGSSLYNTGALAYSYCSHFRNRNGQTVNAQVEDPLKAELGDALYNIVNATPEAKNLVQRLKTEDPISLAIFKKFTTETARKFFEGLEKNNKNGYKTFDNVPNGIAMQGALIKAAGVYNAQIITMPRILQSITV